MSRIGRPRGPDGERRSGHEPEDRVVVGAGGVVFNATGAVLLLRHANGSWVFPKGHIEAGESALEAALREVEEEAGVVAHCDDASASWTTTYRNPRGERRRITWFRLRADAREPLLREELFPGGAFVEPDEALTRLTFTEDRLLLRRLLHGDEPDATAPPEAPA